MTLHCLGLCGALSSICPRGVIQPAEFNLEWFLYFHSFTSNPQLHCQRKEARVELKELLDVHDPPNNQNLVLKHVLHTHTGLNVHMDR